MNHRFRAGMLALFFTTGFASLVYEVLWVRMFTLVFGATVFAVSTVLTAFFAGLALGSLVFGRVADRFGRPLLLYGLIEVGIGCYALAFPSLLSGLEGMYVDLAETLGDSFYALSLARFLICSLLILLPTTLMGATLPILGRFYVEVRELVSRSIGFLYAINTVGASLGCLVTGFVLIETIGVSRTHNVAIALNIVVGAIALRMHYRIQSAPAQTVSRAKSPVATRSKKKGRRARAQKRRSAPAAPFSEYPRGVTLIALGAFSVSGAAALGYEVLWTRTLGVALQSTTYSFTLILTTFLCGLALGSYLYGKLARRLKRFVLAFGVIQVSVGAYSLALIHFFGVLPELAARHIEPSESHWGLMVALQFLMCFSVMLVPTVLLGGAFPLVCRICTSRLDSLGVVIGRVNAVNSFGAIVGSFVVGFVVIPLIGVKQGMMVVASVNVLTGIVALACSTEIKRRTKRIAMVAVAGIAGVGLQAARKAELYVGVGANAGQRKILYYEDGLVANVRVEQTDDNVVLLINDNVQAGIRGARSSQGLGHIPLLLHPEPQRVLTIGMGAGMTAGAATKHQIESVKIVELVDSLVRSAPFFARQNYDVLNNSATNFIVGDGRNFLLTTQERFDVIVSDIFFPAGAGTGSLYALEHYELAKSRLQEGGLMVQWLPLYQLAEDEFKVIAATFLKAFPHSELWLGDPDLMYPVVGLVGREVATSIDLGRLRQRVAREAVSADLVYGADAVSLLGAYLMGSSELAVYTDGAPLNTDDRPLIEFSAPRNDYSNRRLGWETIQRLTVLKSSVVPWLDLESVELAERDAFVRRVEAFEAARSQFYRGTFALGEGRAEEGYRFYQEARGLAPEDKFVDFHTSESIGRLQVELGNPERAIVLLESAATIRPDELEPRLLLAELYSDQGQWDRALQHLTAVTRIYPEHVTALGRLGQIYASHQRWEEANSALERALDILPFADTRLRILQRRVQRQLASSPPG